MFFRKNSIILACTLSLVSTQISHSQSAEQAQANGSIDQSGKFTPQNNQKDSADTKRSQQQLNDHLELKDIGENKLQLGDIILDKQARTVSFPVQVNMQENAVEYFLVSNKGKLHESVFSTSVSPTHLHFACVLLGMQPVNLQDWPGDNSQIAPKNAVSIHLTWPTNGPQKVVPLASCVVKNDLNENIPTQQTMADGAFFYSGSHFFNESFLAESEGSIISVISDASALINGIRPDNKNDLQYSANGSILPLKGRTITMVLTLPKLSPESH